MWQFVDAKRYLPDDMQAKIKAVSEDLLNIKSGIDSDAVVISGHLPFFMKLGLSFSDEFSPHKDFMVTTVKAFEKTECLTAIDDTLTGSDHHYTITPVNYATFPEWVNSYDNGKKYPHPYTVALKQWVIKIHCL